MGKLHVKTLPLGKVDRSRRKVNRRKRNGGWGLKQKGGNEERQSAEQVSQDVLDIATQKLSGKDLQHTKNCSKKNRTKGD